MMSNDEDGAVAQPGDSVVPHPDAARVRSLSLVLIDAMPVAMAVIDAVANVVYANQRLVDMVGIPAEALSGRSALDFIDGRDVEFALSLLGAGSEFNGLVMGPSRIRYVDRAGESHYSQFWAHESPPELGVEGYIVTLTVESVRDVLATAVASVGSDEPLDRTLAAIATCGRAAPLDAVGTILVVEHASVDDVDRFRCVGEWPLAADLINDVGTPWQRCLVTGDEQDVLDCTDPGLHTRVGAEMTTADLSTAWVRPVLDAAGQVAAIFVVWRTSSNLVSPNQEAHLGEAIRLAHLAIERTRHRTELEVAAHRDALTGVGNRASLNERFDLEESHLSVLFIDLDQFKSVNDTFGHAVGDEVIAQAGRRRAEAGRRSDDVNRSGGDEFVVVCAPESDRSDAPHALLALAERIVEQLEAPFDCREHRIRIGATIGIAAGESATGVERDLPQAIAAADQAMYLAKEHGRGSIHHADAPS